MKILPLCDWKDLRVLKKKRSSLFFKRMRRILCQTLCGKDSMLPMEIKKSPKTQRCSPIRGLLRLRKSFVRVLLICLFRMNN
jgi:hypothetical protein